MQRFLVFLILIIVGYSLKAQHLKAACYETKKKARDDKYPVLTKTCFIKNFKFIATTYPDVVGRYFWADVEVFVKSKNKYVETTNSKVFNDKQGELITMINAQIQEDFNRFKTDSTSARCLPDIDSIPGFQMDDLLISFEDDKIRFEVHWGLPDVCRWVDGTVVSFKISEVLQYLK